MLVVRASDDAAEIASALAERLVERMRADGVDVTRAPRVLTPDEGDPVADALHAAEEEFASIALDEAWQTLDAALVAIDGGALRSRAELVDVLLVRSMIASARGDEAAADEAARAALGVEPALVVDPARYPPTLSERVERLRGSTSACTLAITVDPSDATVLVDGDASTSAVTCGTHWISARRDGYARVTRRVEIDATTPPIALSLAIDPAAALAHVGAVGAPVPALAERAAAVLGRELVVLDVARDAETHGLDVTLDDRTIHATRDRTPDELAATLLAPITRGDDTPLWIGLGVGAGAVAIAVAIVVGVVATSAAPSGWVGMGEVVRP